LGGFAARDRLAGELATATATVAAAVGGIPELVTHGRTGLLVPPGNSTALAAAMAALAGDPGRAAVLGRVARQQVAGRHDPGDHAEALLDRYRRVIDRAARAGTSRPVTAAPARRSRRSSRTSS